MGIAAGAETICENLKTRGERMVSAATFLDSVTPRWAAYDHLLDGLPDRVRAAVLLLTA